MSMHWLRMMLLMRRRRRKQGTYYLPVVMGCVLGFTDPTATGVVQMISPPSTTVKIDDKGVYAQNPQFMIMAGAISAGVRLLSNYTGTFFPSAEFNTVDSFKPLRENDTQFVTAPGQQTYIPFFYVPYITTVKIVDPGQQTVKMQ